MFSAPGYFEYSEFPWGRIVAAFMCLCLFGVLVVAVRGAKAGPRRRLVAVVTVAWSILWLSAAWFLIAPTRTTVDGATIVCASPAAASTMHGVPDDSSMSETSVACRTAGRWRLGLLTVLVASGTAAAVVAIRPRSSIH